MIKKLLSVFIMLFLAACTSIQPKAPLDHAMPPPLPKPLPVSRVNEEIKTFIAKSSKMEGLAPAEMLSALDQAHFQPQIIAMMNHPYESLPWSRYEALYISHAHVVEGAEFWQAHTGELNLAEKQFGVPPQIIVAILGVETIYGQDEGSFRALDALYTLAFDYPRRSLFFQNELDAYLVLVHEAGFDPLSIKSSYAGALGMPQFMPSTYRKYAVSASLAYPNLFTDPNDAIGSIANYFAKIGWERGDPVAMRAHLAKHTIFNPALLNTPLTIGQFKTDGIHAEQHMPAQLMARLIALPGQTGPEYWLVFHNFYVIKLYNASVLYALAVYQLSEQIVAQRTADLRHSR